MDQPNAERIDALGEMFRMLSEPNRLRLVLACMEQPRYVGDLARELGASPSLVSHHLRLLRSTRLLRGEREGQHVRYRLNDDHVRAMLGNMLEHVHEDGGEDHEQG